MNAIDELAARYVAIWNEPNEAKRNAGVASLWSADARAYTSANEYIGLDAITRRVAATYEKFVATDRPPIQAAPHRSNPPRRDPVALGSGPGLRCSGVCRDPVLDPQPRWAHTPRLPVHRLLVERERRCAVSRLA